MKTLLFKPSFYYFFLLFRTKIFPFVDKRLIIGNYLLKMPGYHFLDLYKYCFPKYDEPIANICMCLKKGNKKIYAIDIGANVGDSALQMNKFTDVDVLCIEGDNDYLSYLESNLSQIKSSKFEKCFVATKLDTTERKRLFRTRGTTKIIPGSESNPKFTFKTFKEIIKKNSAYKKSSFLKIDTDGYDFQIINNNLEMINEMKPILYYENTINNLNDLKLANETIMNLISINYQQFVVLDNFGRRIALIKNDRNVLFALNSYLLENTLSFNSINYFDIIAFPKKSDKIFQRYISMN